MRKYLYLFPLLLAGCYAQPTPEPVVETPKAIHIQSSPNDQIEQVIFKDVPNREFESQLPEEVRKNYRVANIVPGEDIFVLEQIPKKYWLLLYKDNTWFVTEQEYSDLPGVDVPVEDTTEVDQNTALIQP